ncbi:MAG: Veg family protein [Christensenellales bacterium]
MKKNLLSLSEVKDQILALKGENVKLTINRGRKRIEKMVATIDSCYPSVFTVKTDETQTNSIQTFSYSDVLCGDVKVSTK